jgi:hypothetical protein
MASQDTTRTGSKGMLWAGYIITGLITAFMLLDGVLKIIKIRPVVEGTAKLGFPESSIRVIGFAALISAVLYAIPVTTVLGAILLTGFLGGAVVTHLRAGDPAFQCIFPILFGIVAWMGIYLRDARLRSLAPLRRPAVA